MTTWSKYQQAVFQWVDRHVATPGALVVEAVAGSGKTTTIVEAAKRIPVEHKAVFLAFNKSIATELGKRLPSTVESKTLNALGFGVVRRYFSRVEVEANKTLMLLDGIMGPDADRDYKRDVANAVAKAKSHGYVPPGTAAKGGIRTSFEVWGELCGRYDIDVEDLAGFAKLADAALKATLEQTNLIDFDDMMYFVVAFDMNCPKYDWIIVDEAQDVSHVQREMLRKFLKPDGRLIAVGDTRQAIYGFRGADSDSMPTIQKVFNAETLPLSISYRCPKAVVNAAKNVVPYIEARDDAPEGEVRAATAADLEVMHETDLVVCRYTAPIITIAYSMLARRIPVRVQGRDIGVGLQNLIKKIAGKNWSSMDIETFNVKLLAWAERETQKAMRKNNEAALDVIQDKLNSINAVSTGGLCETVASIIEEIDGIFSSSRGVLLSTVHRAKGLEAPRVFILDPDCMPSKRAKQAWQLEQEYNLIYVATTRALESLLYVNSDQFKS